MTSEEKLLGLLRRSSRERKAAAGKDQSQAPAGLTDRQWLWINGALVLAAAVVFFIAGVRYLSWTSSSWTVERNVSSPSIPEQDAVPVWTGFEDVRDVFAARNVFQSSPSDSPEAEAVAEMPVVVPPPVDLSQQYRIVGIVLGQRPTAIVESVQNASTLFLEIGSSLDQATVKEIQQDKVILEWNGQTVELKS